jgi:hypothetical protein
LQGKVGHRSAATVVPSPRGTSGGPRREQSTLSARIERVPPEDSNPRSPPIIRNGSRPAASRADKTVDHEWVE